MAGSVSGVRNSWYWGYEFESRVEYRDYFKILKQNKT